MHIEGFKSCSRSFANNPACVKINSMTIWKLCYIIQVLKHDNPAHSSSEIVSPPPPSGSSSPFTRLSSPPPPRNKILPFRPVSKIKIEDNFSRSHTPLELAESFQQPISIAMLTPHYFGEGYARLVPDCSFAGVPLHCTYYGLGNNQSTEATALWWHAPGMCPLHVSLSSYIWALKMSLNWYNVWLS